MNNKENITDMKWTFPKWLILKELYKIDVNSELSMTEIAKFVKISNQHPYFIEVIKFLIKSEVIEVTREVGKTKLIKFNKKKLLSEIVNNIIYYHFVDFVKTERPLTYSIPS